MVIVNPGDGTETGKEEDADRDQFINEMKADFEEGKQKVTQWKNNIINQGLGYSLCYYFGSTIRPGSIQDRTIGRNILSQTAEKRTPAVRCCMDD